MELLELKAVNVVVGYRLQEFNKGEAVGCEILVIDVVNSLSSSSSASPTEDKSIIDLPSALEIIWIVFNKHDQYSSLSLAFQDSILS